MESLRFAWPPVLRHLHGMLQTKRRRVATRVLRHFRLSLLHLSEARSTFEAQSIAIYGASQAERFKTHQVLTPFRYLPVCTEGRVRGETLSG